MDPLVLIEEVDRATARLEATARTLDDDAVAAPSLLPGWSRGHVLTHVARNADGNVNLLNWAQTGVRTPQYESMQVREAGIEAGKGRPAAEQLADVIESAQRMSEEARQMPAEAWSAEIEWTSGRRSLASDVVWSRLKEVEIHHVDLDAGYSASDWPEAFTLRLIKNVVTNMTARDPELRMVLRAPELGRDLVVGAGETPVISGSAAAIAVWLIGRAKGDDLEVEGGSLPDLPAWG